MRRWLPPVLLGRQGLGREQQWRLVESLYRKGSLVEGGLSLTLTQILCGLWGGRPVLFSSLAILGLVLLLVRMWLSAGFADLSEPEQSRHSPEQWAAWFTAGVSAISLLWGATVFAALGWITYAPLHAITLTVAAGWLGGACVRNAASPAAVLAQGLPLVTFAVLGALASGIPVYQATAFVFVLMFATNRRIATDLGLLLVSLLSSEQKLAEANAQLEALSITDSLTGIGNRRGFDARLATEWTRACRTAKPLGVLMLDVDLFKTFNDTHGHQAGDACLQQVAAAIAANLRRPPDFAARYGGEEFVVLLPGVDLNGAVEVADHLRRAIMALRMAHPANQCGLVTISVGAASMRPSSALRADTLVEAADQALYSAKQAGRNRVRWGLGQVTSPNRFKLETLRAEASNQRRAVS